MENIYLDFEQPVIELERRKEAIEQEAVGNECEALLSDRADAIGNQGRALDASWWCSHRR